MENLFDGRKIRDEILGELSKEIKLRDRAPHLAVFLIGENPVCESYVELKKKQAEKIGVTFSLYRFDDDDSEEGIFECIDFLNKDEEVDGIMIQIPISEKFDRNKLIGKISPAKDIDGLRYCLGLDSNFKPPVVLAIMKALELSSTFQETATTNQTPNFKIEKLQNKKIVLVGHGFLVGAPLARALEEIGVEPIVVLNEVNNLKENERSFADAQDDIGGADIIVSATGQPNIIKEEMVKEGVVLVDAGTAEFNGQLVGDIEPEAYKKSSYYTPVPGGIGPVTVAMLFKNLIK
ncbi:MAG: bifunctional 5,10-methylenetetrahydrofolate dehydrogenase/5,10-methenyltetrahydrofolate cyclohydrolase [Patescibacteria group bacterium]